MTMVILWGDDTPTIARRRDALCGRARAAGACLETLEILAGGRNLLDAVRTPALFAPRRAIDAVGAERITSEIAVQLAEAFEQGSAALVVARAVALSDKQLNALAFARIEHFAEPGAAAGRDARISRLARAYGVTLGAAQLLLLAQLSAHDLAKAPSVLAACAAGGIDTPTSAQLRVLVGADTEAGDAGAAARAALEGRLADALTAARDMDPLVVLAAARARLGGDPTRVVPGRRQAWEAIATADARIRDGVDKTAALAVALGVLAGIGPHDCTPTPGP